MSNSALIETPDWNNPVWEGERDFGNGVRRYRCMDICTKLGQSNFEYLNERLGWRRVNNYDVRNAMHKFISATCKDPF